MSIDPMGMTDRKAKKAGLFMCLVLRHNPSAAHVTADAEGWVDLEAMIRGSHGRLTRELVLEIVATNNKQRFAISSDGKKIRAKQGHSFPVDLKLEPVTPPDVLYHGTYPDVVNAILRDGLKKMERHHVHMAEETGTATSVGIRKGSPVLFCINAKAMHAAGHKFYRSENGVWLADHVPPEFLVETTKDPQFFSASLVSALKCQECGTAMSPSSRTHWMCNVEWCKNKGNSVHTGVYHATSKRFKPM